MKTLSLSLFCAIVVSSSALSAQTLYDWNQPDVPAVVTTSSKVIFIGKKKAPVRVYSFKGSKGANKTSVYLADLDRDGSPEVVGAGRPLFTLASNSDPIKFSKKGCAQALVADFTEDNKLDIACVDGRNLKVYTHDLQMKWESKVPMTLKWCRAGDVNGDLKADLECNVGGKKFLRFDGAGGEMLTPKATDTIEVQNPVNPTIADVGALDSKTMYDLDGDGTKKEALTKDGKSIFVGSKKVALDGEPLSALVKDDKEFGVCHQW